MIPKAPAHELGLKDALVHAGLLDKSKAGRGRPSKEMTENGEMLVREHGYRIKGLSLSTAAPKTEGTEVKPAKVERIKPATNAVAELPPQMRGDDVIPIAGGKPWKMGIKGCCNLCRQSLTHCPCPQPMVFLDHITEVPVTFKAKGAVR